MIEIKTWKALTFFSTKKLTSYEVITEALYNKKNSSFMGYKKPYYNGPNKAYKL